MSTTVYKNKRVRLKRTVYLNNQKIPHGWHGVVVHEVADNGIGKRLLYIDLDETGARIQVYPEDIDFV